MKQLPINKNISRGKRKRIAKGTEIIATNKINNDPSIKFTASFLYFISSIAIITTKMESIPALCFNMVQRDKKRPFAKPVSLKKL
jgi:hypothetical protein